MRTFRRPVYVVESRLLDTEAEPVRSHFRSMTLPSEP
jgi:hypothetical protein